MSGVYERNVHGSDLAARYEMVRERLQAGEFGQAEAIGLSILKKHPKDTEILHLLAIAALRKGDLKKAARRYQEALAVNPSEAVFHSNLGEVLRLSGQPELGAASCRRAVELQPYYVQAHGNLGACLVALRDFEGAKQAFEKALELLPNDPGLISYRADTLRELGKISEAIQGYETAIALDPGAAHAHGNLGSLLIEVGRSTLALEHCRKAVELDSRSGRAHLNLGKCLHVLGRLDEAMDAYVLAHERMPASAVLCTNIGEVWQEVADFPQAKIWYERALEIEPKRVLTRIRLAEVLREQGDLEGSVRDLRKILEEAPGEVEVHVALAKSLWDDGDAEGAVAAHRRAVELRPEQASLYALLGTVLASSGDTTAAVIAQREALKHNPRCVPALAELATNLRGQATEEDVRQMQALLEEPWLHDGPRASLHLGLAHYYDGKKEFEKAGEHGLKGNACQWAHKSKRGWNYRPEQYTRFVDHMIEIFTPEYMRRVAEMGHPSETPVFVLGMPRSGTTLTEQILASHSRAFGVGERHFASRSLHCLPAVMGKTGATIFSCLPEVRADVLRSLGDTYLQHLWKLVEKGKRVPASVARIVDKMPDNYSMVGWILTLFPKAKIIHTRRDVRDVAVSCWITHFGAIQWASCLDHLTERIVQYDRIMKHWRQMFPGRMFETDYEAMVADQEGQSRRLVEWIGLEWDPACLNFHQNERLVRTASVTQVRQPIYKRSVERWRAYEKPLKPLFDRLKEAGIAG